MNRIFLLTKSCIHLNETLHERGKEVANFVQAIFIDPVFKVRQVRSRKYEKHLPY